LLVKHIKILRKILLSLVYYIRDANSERHLKMTDEERKKEANKALEWLSQKLSKPLKIVNK